MELLQEVTPGHAPSAQVVLATFETSGNEFLFPYPQLRPTYTSGVDVDLLMEPTRDFPGVIAPKVLKQGLPEGRSWIQSLQTYSWIYPFYVFVSETTWWDLYKNALGLEFKMM